MPDERLFPLVAMLCVLFWLLARSGRLSPAVSRVLVIGSFILLGTGIAYALLLAIAR